MDRRAVFVGSFNFDPRSVWLDSEMGFWIESPALATTITDALDRGAATTWQVGLDPAGALAWTGTATPTPSAMSPAPTPSSAPPSASSPACPSNG